MAQFYGTVQGTRGEASRLGTRTSGIRTRACSWAGAIEVYVSEDVHGVERFSVTMVQHQGEGDYRVLAEGKVGDASSVVFLGGRSTKPADMPAADLAQLAVAAGALDSNSDAYREGAIAFTHDTLREFVQLLFAHAEITR